MVTVKQLKEWLRELPDNAPIEPRYFERDNAIYLAVTHTPVEKGYKVVAELEVS